MNQQHKFRAWDKVRDQWIYFIVGQINDHTMKEVYDRLCIEGVKFYQWIGLTDKHGIEIYEGDKVQYIGEKKTIKWEESTSTSYGHGDSSHQHYIGFSFGYYGSEYEPDELEIIGNIEQNPELHDLDGKSTPDA